MREYELILIFDPKLTEEKTKKVLAKIADWIKPKGKVVKQGDWGKKRLAYPMKSHHDGKMFQEANFVQIDFEADVDAIAVVDKNLKLEDKVIRFLIVKKEPTKGGGKVGGKKSK